MNYFITGTDTGVGKTYVTCLLVRSLRRAGFDTVGMKPICCGGRSDAESLLEASGGGYTLDEINPVWLPMPAAPYATERLEKGAVNPGAIRSAFARLRGTHRSLLVEGVGGWRVPVAKGLFMSDLAREFGLPVLVVVRNRLGALNHTVLTVERIVADGLQCGGIILNHADAAEEDEATAVNRAILEELLEAPVLFEIKAGQKALSLGIV